MKIGELAAAAECDVQTIRFYERSGLLPKANRTTSNYREYGPAHLERLRFVRRCRTLDMALEEIRSLLGFVDEPQRNCEQVNMLLDEHLVDVRTRIEELTALELELKRLRRQCKRTQAAGACGILAELKVGATIKRSKSVARTGR